MTVGVDLLPPNRPRPGIQTTHCAVQSGGTSALPHEIYPGSNRAGSYICEACKMSSTNGHDTSMRAALAAAEAAASRPSPADTFNIDREGPAKSAGKFRALQQRFEKLNEYCDETVAEIRASLERAPPG
ncbi:hypothetical protein [Bradyrhizobium australiense]|uniref:Uncharacterized protein n=1 Tax=Bradyrhizobium australiense TaxID=2721161 RepID=A0A7Y4LWE1_9BRAD|nr:hypothetical protein [Bradyrhizobium australiense]NOJ41323.1 hypothetical protein [Bradyrhizobium australiense]